MGDANMENMEDLVDYNDLPECIDSLVTNKDHVPLSRSGDSSFYDPYVPRPPRGSIEDIQHKLKL